MRSILTASVRNRSGLALVATLLVLTVMAVLVAAAVKASMTAVRTAGIEYNEARVFYAAEAGAEAALSQLKLALQDGFLADGELENISPPALDEFNFDSFSVIRRGAAVVDTISDGPYAGLYALTQNVDIYSLAADDGGNAAGVILDAKAQAIPIFQFGVFFEEDLEATNGPPMTFVGRVHSNGNIYLSSANAWYLEMITTPNKVFHNRKDHNRVLDGVFIFNPELGDTVQLDFDSRTHPGAEAFKAMSELRFASQLRTDAFDTDSLRLPLPPGVPAIELIRPRDPVGDGDAEKSVKFAWNADTYVTVDLVNTTSHGLGCGAIPAVVSPPPDLPTITIERFGRPTPTGGELCAMFYWNWSAFYDGREDELKDVLEIDLQEIDNWVAGDPNRAMELIYIEFINPGGIGLYSVDTRNAILDADVDPAVRLRKGSELPNRLTVATDWPLYVQGDYNSNDKKPAAVAGDGVTILSENWDDDPYNRPEDEDFEMCNGTVSYKNPCPFYVAWAADWEHREAGETTVNAAILAGHWPTPCDWIETGCPADGSSTWYHDWYGGGIENFPRFLEEWRAGGDRVVFHYKGALVSPFTSQQTTGTWNGDYYVPPQRDWWFDIDFRDPEKLPPGTPNVGYVVRTAMREAF